MAKPNCCAQLLCAGSPFRVALFARSARAASRELLSRHCPLTCALRKLLCAGSAQVRCKVLCLRKNTLRNLLGSSCLRDGPTQAALRQQPSYSAQAFLPRAFARARCPDGSLQVCASLSASSPCEFRCRRCDIRGSALRAPR